LKGFIRVFVLRTLYLGFRDVMMIIKQRNRDEEKKRKEKKEGQQSIYK
jgi:hypothetical protein